MRILLAHNFYQRAGGEDAALLAEKELLERHGHEVELIVADNKEINGLAKRVAAALRASYSRPAKRFFFKKIKAFQPQLVHVHNFFPRLTPAIFDACQEAGVPVVHTLHNFRILCPGALFLRNGEICEDCLQDSPYQAVKHACYRNSHLGSLIVARMVAVHRRSRTWRRKVDRFIALTEFSKARFVAGGIPAEKISVKPNFVNDPCPDNGEENGLPPEPAALFVGRLSSEKGIDTLLTAWRQVDTPLRIVGDGPMMSMVEQVAPPHVKILGNLPSRQVGEEMARASFLIVPSLCYENLPLVLCEAYSYGLPVLASNLGSLTEMVIDGETGLLFEPANPAALAARANWAVAHPVEMRQMGRNARRYYLEYLTPEKNFAILLGIYQDVIDSKSSTR